MNRAELIDALAERTELTRKDATAVVGHLFNPNDGIIAKAIKKGDKVVLTGFGAFTSRKRNARKARNPQTGETIKVAATKVPAFKAGAGLKAAISGKAAPAAAKKGAAKKGAAKKGAAKKGAAKKGRK